MLSLPSTMIWVHGRWAVIFHLEPTHCGAQLVRQRFLEQPPPSQLSLYEWVDGEFPTYTMDPNGTFATMHANVHYNFSELVVQPPGSDSAWAVELPRFSLNNTDSPTIDNLAHHDAPSSAENLPMANFSLVDPQLIDVISIQQARASTSVRASHQATNEDYGGWNSFGTNTAFADAINALSTANRSELSFPDGIEDEPFILRPVALRPGSATPESCPSSPHSESSDSDSSANSDTEALDPLHSVLPNMGNKRGGKSKSTRPKGRGRSKGKLSHSERLRRSMERRVRDDLLIQGRAMGISYRKIKEQCNIADAESTLRGRYRTLLQKMEQEKEDQEEDAGEMKGGEDKDKDKKNQ